MDSPTTVEQKKQRWQELLDWCHHVTQDGPIDLGIIETVVALNAHGLHTIQSCEGHADRGSCAPWVEIAPPDSYEYLRRVQQAKKDLQKRRAEKQTDRDELRQVMTTYVQLQRDYFYKHLPDRRRLFTYLSSFYEARQTSYERQIIVYKGNGFTGIRSQGSILYELAPPEVRRQKLQEYQQEMQDFTAFLKQIYFSDNEGIRVSQHL